jgi:gamma-glutamyltranspeptidase/glutathione hydrolase
MKMIEYDISQMGHNSVKTIQVITEAGTKTADRNSPLREPRFCKTSVKELLDSIYCKQDQ